MQLFLFLDEVLIDSLTLIDCLSFEITDELTEESAESLSLDSLQLRLNWKLVFLLCEVDKEVRTAFSLICWNTLLHFVGLLSFLVCSKTMLFLEYLLIRFSC